MSFMEEIDNWSEKNNFTNKKTCLIISTFIILILILIIGVVIKNPFTAQKFQYDLTVATASYIKEMTEDNI